MAEIGVVHLVRRKIGVAPFERFLASYREHRAGIPHDLVLVFKGFPFGRGTEAYDRLLADVPHRRMYLSDYGLDLRTYFMAAKRFDYRYFCFLNSFSRILHDNWLAKLYRWITTDGVGLVGATGSYESLASNHAERVNMLSKLGLLARLRWRLTHISSDPNPRIVTQRAVGWTAETLGLGDPGRHFPPFPNFHIRTNAFMVARQTLLRVKSGPMLFKLSAYAFESGLNSLTQQIIHLGLKSLVVARTGESFEKEQWHLSNTFRQSLQENLLIADNQTDVYRASSAAERALLSRQAWHEFARPA
jgi:hypothetical protein